MVDAWPQQGLAKETVKQSETAMKWKDNSAYLFLQVCVEVRGTRCVVVMTMMMKNMFEKAFRRVKERSLEGKSALSEIHRFRKEHFMAPSLTPQRSRPQN